jgi:hypothetical protein
LNKHQKVSLENTLMLNNPSLTSFFSKYSYAPFWGGCLGLLISQSVANAFTPFPIYDNANSYTVDLPTTGSDLDPTDIYYPVSVNPTDTLPIALMLQGALVDKADYANYATLVARYGFIVVVPNHERTLVGPMGSFTGFFPDVELVNDVLTFMETENLDNTSPVFGQVKTTEMGILGHSFGGAVGLTAIQGICFPILCTTTFNRPSALKAGIVYGAGLVDQMTGEIIPIDNEGIPTGFIAGELDGVEELDDVIQSYNKTQDPPKVLVTVLGANHYGITNEDNPLRDPSTPAIAQSVATETIARWSALFLRSHIQEDREAFQYVYGTGDAMDDNVTVISEQIPEPSLLSGILGIGFSLILVRMSK